MAEEVGITRWLRALEKADERRLRAGYNVTFTRTAEAVIGTVAVACAGRELPTCVARLVNWRVAYDLGITLPPAEAIPLPERIRLAVDKTTVAADVVIDESWRRAVVVVTGHVPPSSGPRELFAQADGARWYVRVSWEPPVRYTVNVRGPDGVRRSFRMLFGRSPDFGLSLGGALLRHVPSKAVTRRAFEIALAAALACGPSALGSVRIALVPIGRTPDERQADLPPMIVVNNDTAAVYDSWLARLADEGDAAAALFARALRRALPEIVATWRAQKVPCWWPAPKPAFVHHVDPPVRLVPDAPRARLVRLADRLLNSLSARGHADRHEFRATDGRLVARLWVPRPEVGWAALTLVDRVSRARLRQSGMLKLTHEVHRRKETSVRGDVLLAPGVVIRRDPMATPTTVYVHRADDPATALQLFLAFAPDAEIVRFPSGARGERFARLLQTVMPAVRMRSFGARRALWADALCGLANRRRLPGGFVTLDLRREDRS